MCEQLTNFRFLNLYPRNYQAGSTNHCTCTEIDDSENKQFLVIFAECHTQDPHLIELKKKSTRKGYLVSEREFVSNGVARSRGGGGELLRGPHQREDHSNLADTNVLVVRSLHVGKGVQGDLVIEKVDTKAAKVVVVQPLAHEILPWVAFFLQKWN